MDLDLDPFDRELLDRWQSEFPLTSQPFAVIAGALGVTENEVLERLNKLSDAGAISRIGATCRPNTAGASTLAAVAAPELRIEEVAAIIGAEPGVNHSYLRENHWNIWFVATGPDRAHVDESLVRIGNLTELEVLDLRLVRPFNINLGFALDGSGKLPPHRENIDTGVLIAGDREIMQALSIGLEIVAQPLSLIHI